MRDISICKSRIQFRWVDALIRQNASFMHSRIFYFQGHKQKNQTTKFKFLRGLKSIDMNFTVSDTSLCRDTDLLYKKISARMTHMTTH